MTVSATPPSTSPSPAAAAGRRLEALFAEHGPAVYAYARRRAEAARADEVVSETFLVAWRRVSELPPEPLPWLLGVARKCLANLDRGEARQVALQMRLAAVPQELGVMTELDEGLTSEVAAALDQLSPAEREVLTLLAWEGLTPAEAAIALGCSRAAVYLRLHRARRRFADHFSLPINAEDPR